MSTGQIRRGPVSRVLEDLQLRTRATRIWVGVREVITIVAATNAQMLMVNIHILLPYRLLIQLPARTPDNETTLSVNCTMLPLSHLRLTSGLAKVYESVKKR